MKKKAMAKVWTATAMMIRNSHTSRSVLCVVRDTGDLTTGADDQVDGLDGVTGEVGDGSAGDGRGDRSVDGRSLGAHVAAMI